ncbi:SDR family NAD(P)-dependent oxidoreductase [Oenococcus kitaharae]|nr:SDR family NAD(P)-dependent oxidoreductase [Oenococcus kitaharae]MCV3295541.1 SDR family NAD(P)-dependent oxidoreductase [Oenococcus kitaharae]
MQLSNNIILITGGTSGIGLAFAKKLIELGNTVIVTGRSQKKIDRVLSENPGLVALTADVSDLDSVKSLVQTMTKDYPKLNIVINSAGIMRPEDLFDPKLAPEELTEEIDINLKGTIWMDQLLLPLLSAQTESMIVNITSGLANLSMHATPTYSATKAGLRMFTNALRFQASRQAPGLHIVELVPPLVRGTSLEANKNIQNQGITTDQLVTAGIAGMAKNKKRINVAQSKAMQLMGRSFPMFFENRIAKSMTKANQKAGQKA